jgi:hypothetical protein
MKPTLKDGKLSVELHKTDTAQLTKARFLGRLLRGMHQEEGDALIEAVNAILAKFGGKAVAGEE